MTGKSPNYPSIGLSVAIDNAQKLFKAHGRKPVTPQEAVASWGHNSLHGSATVELSALKKYGLLEASGRDALKLSSRAIELTLGREDTESYRKALLEAALLPPLFREVYEEYKGDLPSDQVLKLHLVKEKSFTESGADKFIQAFRDTLAVAALKDVAHTGGEKLEPEGITKAEAEMIPRPSEKITAGHEQPGGSVSVKGRPIGSIPVTRQCAITIVADGNLTQQGLKRLKAYIDLIEPSFPEDDTAPQ